MAFRLNGILSAGSLPQAVQTLREVSRRAEEYPPHPSCSLLVLCSSLCAALPLPHILVYLLTVSKRSGAFFSTSWTRALCFATIYRGQEEPVCEGLRGPADAKCDEITVG